MEITGTIVQTFGLESGISRSGKAWSKASIVIQTDGLYPKKVLLTNFKRAEEFSKLAVGTGGTFQFDIESREWTNPNTGKISWFTEATCWNWNILLPTSPQPSQSQMAQQSWDAVPPPQTAQPAQEELLPF